MLLFILYSKMNHFVSIIIPCLNEERFIERCLKSLTRQSYPKDRMEILAVDGMSKDRTRGIVKKYSFVKLLDNPKRIIPCAMNIGIKKSKGDIIIKADAHTDYSEDFVSNSVKYLTEYKAGNVGGFLINKPAEGTMTAEAICEVLSNPFGVGNSSFRVGDKRVKESDVAAFGCFFKDTLLKAGLYNENMERSEDLELNKRIKKTGKKIYFAPYLVGEYYYKQSSLTGFLKRCFVDGIWITYPFKLGIFVFRLRHIIPFIFVLSLIILGLASFCSTLSSILFWIIVGVYLPFNVFSSIMISVKKKNTAYLLVLPLLFAFLHFGYGLGSVWGLLKLKKA